MSSSPPPVPFSVTIFKLSDKKKCIGNFFRSSRNLRRKFYRKNLNYSPTSMLIEIGVKMKPKLPFKLKFTSNRTSMVLIHYVSAPIQKLNGKVQPTKYYILFQTTVRKILSRILFTEYFFSEGRQICLFILSLVLQTTTAESLSSPLYCTHDLW